MTYGYREMVPGECGIRATCRLPPRQVAWNGAAGSPLVPQFRRGSVTASAEGRVRARSILPLVGVENRPTEPRGRNCRPGADPGRRQGGREPTHEPGEGRLPLSQSRQRRTERLRHLACRRSACSRCRPAGTPPGRRLRQTGDRDGIATVPPGCPAGGGEGVRRGAADGAARHRPRRLVTARPGQPGEERLRAQRHRLSRRAHGRRGRGGGAAGRRGGRRADGRAPGQRAAGAAEPGHGRAELSRVGLRTPAAFRECLCRGGGLGQPRLAARAARAAARPDAGGAGAGRLADGL